MTTILEEVANDRSIPVVIFRQALIQKMTLFFEGDEFIAALELFIAGLSNEMRIKYLNLLLDQEYITSIKQAGTH